MLSFNLTLKSQSAKPFDKMSEMRDSGMLTDVSLKVGEQTFKAHRVVLAASSDYFSAMFTAGMKESFDESIELKDSSVTPDSLKIILDAVYKSELMVTEENVFEVRKAADYLLMTRIIDQCSNFLSNNIVGAQLKKLDLQSLQKVLNTAEKESLFEFQEEVFTRMAAAFKELSQSEDFPEFLSVGQMLNLLQRNNLTAPSETFVFKSLVKWIYHNKEERLSHAAKLFSAVRLGLVDIRVLIRELRREELKEDEECGKLLFEALLYNKMPTLLPELPLIKTERRTLAPVLIAVEPDLPLKYYDVAKKVWQEFGQNIPIKERCTSVVSCENLIFVGSKEKVYVYNTDENSWGELPPMLSSPSEGGSYQLFIRGKHLYAFGNKIAERFCFASSSNRWHACSKIGNSKWAWADLDGCIYAVGNSQTWMFDKSENKWIRKRDNLCNRLSCYAFGYKGKLIIAGGMVPLFNNAALAEGPFVKVSTVEAYCKKSNRWSEVTQNHPLPSPFSGVVVDNTVLIRLNNFVFDTGIKVSQGVPYSSYVHKWRKATNLNRAALITHAPLNTGNLH